MSLTLVLLLSSDFEPLRSCFAWPISPALSTTRTHLPAHLERTRLAEMSSSSLAARLSYDVLYLIFEHLLALDLEERGEFLHGGRLVAWDSNEALRPLVLVCGGWREAATAGLYKSISIQSGASAVRLLTSLKARPQLAQLVRRVAVGVAEDGSPSDKAQAEASKAIFAALQALPNIQHLVLRPLLPTIRPQLLDYFAERRHQIKSLVLIGRDTTDGPRWGGTMRLEDCSILARGLEKLDVDVWDSTARADERVDRGSLSLPNPLELTHLCLDSDSSKSLTYSYICDTLTHLHLYFEHLRPAPEAADALSKARHLRHLFYICNPPLDLLEHDYSLHQPRTLDLVLPSLPLLETLHVSATDISPSFLTVLPPRLHHIIVQTFSPYGFEQPAILVDMLASSALDTKGLRSLEVRDATDRWRGLAVEMEEVCRQRGIAFRLVSEAEIELD